MKALAYLEESDHIVVSGIDEDSASLIELVAVRFALLDRIEQVSLCLCCHGYGREYHKGQQPGRDALRERSPSS